MKVRQATLAAALALAFGMTEGAEAAGAEARSAGACGSEDAKNTCELCHDMTPAGRVARPCREGERGSMGDSSRVLQRGVPPNAEAADQEALRAGPALLPFRVTVDGEVVDTFEPVEAQRRVDRRLAGVDLQIRHDALQQRRALNVWAVPGTVVTGQPTVFGTFSNYQFWLMRAEVRVFRSGQSLQQQPLAIVPVQPNGFLEWRPEVPAGTELRYVLRVYDRAGRFDETAPKTLQVTDRERPLGDERGARRERMIGWGEDNLATANIPVNGGMVTINGRDLAPGDTVKAMGIEVPVADNGRFAIRQILPPGHHAIEVSVRDREGRGFAYRRHVAIPVKDLFFVATADITAGVNNTSGPAALVEGSAVPGSRRSYLDGRLAFYARGAYDERTRFTVSADTREQPLRDLFTNFSSRDPRFLLRRFDSNLFYPTYGDDSTAVDDAPTQGRFYARVDRGDSHLMWGSFLTRMTGTEFSAYQRALYGARLAHNGEQTTAHGERRLTLEAFAADPGTVQSREEFRGTGGSLYFLRNQDVVVGSERLWIEVRDAVSGIVVARKPLVAAQDYEMNYFQGRVMLREPLESTAQQTALVQTGGLSGNPVFLVTTYEFVPGLTATQNLSLGGRVSYWFNDSLRIGMTGFRQGEASARQRLFGIDGTLRYRPGTFLRAEVGHSKGPGTGALTSTTGGFDFNTLTSTGQPARAQRVEGAIDLSEVWAGRQGRASVYWQHRDAGFSAPGQITFNSEALTQRGAQIDLPLAEGLELFGRADGRSASSQDVTAVEIGLRQRVNERWSAAIGMRNDDRSTRTPNASALLSQNGSRTDLVARIDYMPSGRAVAPVPLHQGLGQLPGASVAPGLGGQSPLAPATGMVPLPGQTPPATTIPSPSSPMVASGLPAVTAQGTASGVTALRGQLAPQAGSLPDAPVPAPAGAAAGGAVERERDRDRDRDWNAYAFVQGTADRSGDRTDNNRAGLGGTYRLNDRFRVGAELSDGSGGAGARLLGEYRVDERRSFYVNALTETDRTDTAQGGRVSSWTTGARLRYSDATQVFAEQRLMRGAGPTGLVHGFGLDHRPDDRWSYGARLETGRVSDPLAGDLERIAVAGSIGFVEGRFRYAGALEFRDESAPAIQRQIWLLRNNLGYQVDRDWRALGRLNWSTSSNNQGNFFNADFTELVIGAAYRPADHNRWNALFKYTYFHNVPAPGQAGATSSAAVGNGREFDFAQKSHVLSADAIYRLTPRLSLGGKVAIRHGELTTSRTSSDWYASSARLLALRADWRVTHEWSALGEARTLSVTTADDRRSGLLFAVYRHIDSNLRIGLGYNFTDYSDNLTDLSFRSRGLFINVISVW